METHGRKDPTASPSSHHCYGSISGSPLSLPLVATSCAVVNVLLCFVMPSWGWINPPEHEEAGSGIGIRDHLHLFTEWRPQSQQSARFTMRAASATRCTMMNKEPCGGNVYTLLKGLNSLEDLISKSPLLIGVNSFFFNIYIKLNKTFKFAVKFLSQLLQAISNWHLFNSHMQSYDARWVCYASTALAKNI